MVPDPRQLHGDPASINTTDRASRSQSGDEVPAGAADSEGAVVVVAIWVEAVNAAVVEAETAAVVEAETAAFSGISGPPLRKRVRKINATATIPIGRSANFSNRNWTELSHPGQRGSPQTSQLPSGSSLS